MNMIQLDSTNMFFKTWVVQPISFLIMGWFNQYSFNMGCITTSCFSNIGCHQKNINAFGHHFLFQKQKRIILYLFDLNHGVAKTHHCVFFSKIRNMDFNLPTVAWYFPMFSTNGGFQPTRIWKKRGPGGMRPWWFQTFQRDPARRPIKRINDGSVVDGFGYSGTPPKNEFVL